MTATATEAPAGARIDDFGEHIPGARKDMTARGIARGIDADPQCTATLAVAWPLPQWSRVAAEHAAAGRARFDLATMRAMRDQLRTEAGRAFERAAADSVGPRRYGLRGLALGVLEDRWTAEAALGAVAGQSPGVAERCETLAVLYAEIGHETDLSGCTVDARRDRTRWFVAHWANNTPTRANGATLHEAARELKAILGAKRERAAARGCRKKNPYAVRYLTRGREKVYGVYRRASGRWTRVRECGSLAEARRAMHEDVEVLDRWWDAWRNVPAERRAKNAARTPWGGYGTAEPEEFTAQFGFRGVQFGNWVENGRRRKDLLETSEALSDLARVLGWPERALSLGGRLGLAFGARGQGGPLRVRAHYEPLQRVVAISKPAGPGTLAHEWFHALDHHAMLTAIPARRAAGGHGYASEQQSALTAGTALGDLIAALTAYGAAFGNGALAGRSARLDLRRPRSKPYWSTVRELAARAFEAWVVDRLAQLGIRNDYLVNFVPAEEWTGETDLDQGYPYPYKDERFSLAPHIAGIGSGGARTAARWADEAGEALEHARGTAEEADGTWAASTGHSS